MHKLLIIYILFIPITSYSASLVEDWNWFYRNSWTHILKWECPEVKNGRCIKLCTRLKNSNYKKADEINCIGLTVRSHSLFFFQIFNNLANPHNFVRNDVACISPIEQSIQSIYFDTYYWTWRDTDKCYRLMLFDINVLSGIVRAKKSTIGVNLKATKYKHLELQKIRDNYINYLKKIKTYKKYGKGWNNRLNNVYNKSLKDCK